MRFAGISFLFFLLLFAGQLPGGDKLPVTRSVCLLKSAQGSGSGFFASFEGKDVVVTNNHVVLGMEDVRIYDINGGEYEYDKVYSSPERDLAVIPVSRTNHAAMPNLKIYENPDMLRTGAAVSAYGDSLGDGVIVDVKGKFLGIGPRDIEVSAPFVPGNSGGPVIENKTGKVIGIATYGRIIRRSSDSLAGSRFAAKEYEPAVRRFATRIDNLKLDEFEPVTKEQIKEDQERYKPFARAYDYIMEVLLDQNIFSDGKKRRIREYFSTHSQFNTGGKWNTTYLKKDALEKWTLIRNIREYIASGGSSPMRNVEETSEEENLRNVWRKYENSFAVRKKKQVSLKCPACDGSGKVKEKLSEDELKTNAKKMRPTYRMVPCDICSGKRSFTFPEDKVYWIAPPGFFDEIAETIRPMPKKVMGFTLGDRIADLNTIFNGFYDKKKLKSSRCGIFTVYSCKGSHKDKEAAETRLWFMGRILMRIDLFYPVRDNSFVNGIYQELIGEYGDDTLFYFNVTRKTYSWDEIRQLFLNQKGNRLLIGHVKEAYNTDPFGVYCFPPNNKIRKIQYHDDARYQGYYPPGASPRTNEPRFICISFLHSFFETCLGLDVEKTQGGRFGSDR